MSSTAPLRQALIALWFISCVLFGQTAGALTFVSFDPHSMAFGGAGVAIARPAQAPLFNPALLSQFRDYPEEPLTFSLHVGARLVDREGFIAGVRHYQDNDAEGEFDRTLTQFNANVDSQVLVAEDFDQLSAATNELFDDIEGLSNRPLRLGGSIGAAFAKTGRNGIAGFFRTYAVGGGIVDFANEDRQLVQAVLDFGRVASDLQGFFSPYADLIRDNEPALQSAYVGGGFNALEQELQMLLTTGPLAADSEFFLTLLRGYHAAYLASSSEIEDVESLIRLPDFDEDLRSSLELQGSLITEIGASFSRRLGGAERLSVGATMKTIEFEIVDYRARIVEATDENLRFRDHRTVSRDANVDIGVAGHIGEHMRWGVVVRNIFDRDIATIRGNTIQVRPQARFGLGWETEKLTLAGDLDLTSNEPLGFDSEKRYLGLGFERRWLRWSLRAGVRHNIVNGSAVYSLGTAVRIGRTKLELSAAGANDTAAVALQFNANF